MLSNTLLQPPDCLTSWLTYTNFLTKKLHEKTGDACLHVLNQCWETASWWDQNVLSIPRQSVMHREILMTSEANNCWYARTILPISTYEADMPLFARLETESLGVLIFEGTQIKRASINTYAIDRRCIEYYWLTPAMHEQENVLWARLSEFRLNSKHPLFLVEILLPGLTRSIVES
jgi:chorismate lyase